MRFSFVGEIVLNGLDTEKPYLKEGLTKKGVPYKSIKMIVRASKSNSAFLEMFGMERDVIKTKSDDGTDLEINWNDRTDPDVIKQVTYSRKFVIAQGEERVEFLSEIDFIDYIGVHFDEINGKRARITGEVEKNEYNGKVTNRYKIHSIYLLDEEEDKEIDEATANKNLKLKGIMYFSKEDIDIADWDSEKKIRINAYSREYMGKDKNGQAIPDRYYELPLVFDASKIDFSKETHVKMLKLRLKQLCCDLTADNKVKITAKNGYYSNNFVINLYQGAEEVEFTYDSLTQVQKEMVDLGMKTVDDFKPTGTSYGERIVRFKVVDFDLRNDYADGVVKEDDTRNEEIKEGIYVPVAPQLTEDAEGVDALNETEEVKPKSKAVVVEEDPADLFA